MRHGTEGRHAEGALGLQRGRSGEPRQIRGTRRQQPRLGAMRAAQPEIDQGPALGGQHHARGLGRDHGLEMQQVDQARLDILRLGQRSGHAQDRLVGKEDGALGHRMHIAGEAEPPQPLDQPIAEMAAAREPGQFLFARTDGLEEIQRLGEARGDQEIAFFRQLADEELEDRQACLANLVIGLHHRKLVQVGQQEARRGARHRGSRPSRVLPSPLDGA